MINYFINYLPSFRCVMFSYRQPVNQGEANNCHLTDLDMSSLDQFNTRDFLGDNSYDTYQRSGSGYNCGTENNSGYSEYRLLHI